MEKKETLAVNYSNRFSPNESEHKEYSAFIAGFNAAESQIDDFSIWFAEWLTKYYHPPNKIGFWQQRILSEYHSTKDLIAKYKESLKQ